MPQGAAYTVEGLVTAFNKQVDSRFNPKLTDLSAIGKSIMTRYNVLPGASADYLFAKFAGGMQEKLGARKYKTLSDAFSMNVKNKKWDDGIALDKVDFERAQAAAKRNPLQGLNIQEEQLLSFKTRAADHPIERALTLLEAGDANTYGVCFDGQNLFDETHAFDIAAGTQKNIVTGTGETLTLIHADVLSAIGALQGFYWTSGDDGAKRLLNPKVAKIDIVCAPALYPKFMQLKTQDNISATESNSVKGYINDIQVHPFTDSDDYYVIDVSDDKRPILCQIEDDLKFIEPSLQSDSYIDEGLLKYGAEYRGDVAYGAWWKAVMVTNT